MDAVAKWPLASETVDGEEFRYIVGGEAFNWKRLAERLVLQLEISGSETPSGSEMLEWIHSDHVFGGLEEAPFRRILGVERWRGHLNYFYGVQLERCLFASIQSRIHRRRFARGLPLSDDAAEEAYVGLYEDEEAALWKEFLDDSDTDASDFGEHGERSLAMDDAFTYWLFKKRIDSSHPAQVAYETQRGLEMMREISEADSRRHRMLMDRETGDLLEFGEIDRRRLLNQSGRPSTGSG